MVAKKWLITVSDDLDTAVRKHLAPGQPLADLVRKLAANEVGNPKLAEQTKNGRPKKDPPQ